MIDFTDFEDTRPLYAPLTDLSNWMPWLLAGVVVLIAAFGYLQLSSKTQRQASGERAPGMARRVASATYRILPVTLLAAAGTAAALSLVPTPEEHQKAAEDVLDSVGYEVVMKYAVERVDAPVDTAVDTVDQLRRGKSPEVTVTLADSAKETYELSYDPETSVTLHATESMQPDPADFQAEDVLAKRDLIDESVRATYDIARIAPVDSANPNNAAAWYRTFGMDTPRSAFEVRVQFIDGHQDVMHIVADTSETIVLVGHGAVDPTDYVK